MPTSTANPATYRAELGIRRLAELAGVDPDTVTSGIVCSVPLTATDPATARARLVAIVTAAATATGEADTTVARTLLRALFPADVDQLGVLAQLVTTDHTVRYGITRGELADRLLRVTDDDKRPVYDTVVDARVARPTWTEPAGSPCDRSAIEGDEMISLWFDELTYTCILLDILDADPDPARQADAKQIFATSAYDNDPIGICLVDCAEAAQLAASI